MKGRLTGTGRIFLSLALMVALLAALAPAGDLAAADNEGSDLGLRAATYGGALVGKLLVILDGILDKYVYCQVVDNGTAPVYVILGLTEQGQTLVTTLATLILNHLLKMVSDSQGVSTDRSSSPP